MFKKQILLTAMLSLMLAACSNSKDNNAMDEASVDVAPEKVEMIDVIADNATPTEPTINVAPPKPVDYSSVSYKITEKGFPKTYAAWGKEWMDDINRMMPLAVLRVASNPKCDTPSTADLSDNRSTPQKEAVFYVDCQNRERFYISQNELTETKEITAESDVLSEDYGSYILNCEELTKASLNYPSSFNPEILSTSAFKGTSGNMVVEMPFTALNSLGAELPQMARCVFSTSGENEVQITNR